MREKVQSMSSFGFCGWISESRHLFICIYSFRQKSCLLGGFFLSPFCFSTLSLCINIHSSPVRYPRKGGGGKVKGEKRGEGITTLAAPDSMAIPSGARVIHARGKRTGELIVLADLLAE